MRKIASAPATSRPVKAPKFGQYTAVDPFGGFDLNLMYVAATTAPASAKEAKLRELTAPNAWGTNGSIIDFDALGKSGSRASSISFLGPILESVDLGNHISHAVLYKNGKKYELGTLRGKSSSAYAMNASGQITGESDGHAFLYEGLPRQGGHMIDLGVISGQGNSVGYALNDAGQVVGTATTIHPRTESHAFIYEGVAGKDGHMVDLGTLGGSVSYAYAVNAAGQVVGQATAIPWPRNHGHNIYHAFLYDGIPGKGGRMYDLGTLPGGDHSVARAINASGQIVGMSAIGGRPGEYAFRYDGIPGKGGRMTPLASGSGSEAVAINDAGYIVGNSGGEGVLWKPDGSVINLRKWLAEVNPRAAGHWGMLRPGKITNGGLIGGSGLYRDEPSGKLIFHRFYLDASGLVSGAKGPGKP
jgi:probable HAF family extracellular repeat protein